MYDTPEIAVKSAKFVISCPDLAHCPESDLPELAIIGRSNVGKSSLINLLCGQKNLALVSKTPGKTKLINYFLIDQKWNLVDLPGYGYAKISKEIRQKWMDKTQEYLLGRPKNLKKIIVLIDISIPPQEIDIDFISNLCRYEIEYIIVFTKSDKVNQHQLSLNIKSFFEAIKSFSPAEPVNFTTTTTKKHSKNKLLSYVKELVEMN
jgi:GTP-binding protein